MKVRARHSVWVLAALATTLTACDDATAPLGAFDPELTAEAMSEMAVAGEGAGEAFAGLALAGDLFSGSTAAELLPSLQHGVLMDAAGARSYATSAATAPFFPSNYLGVTFVWSHGQQRYVESAEPGAPADGIRLIYYAVNPTNGRPSQPITPLGHIDLRDLSTAASQRLGVAVVETSGEADVTLADYIVDASYTATDQQMSVRQAADGYLSNGTHRLNFDLVNEATFTETDFVLEQAYEIALADSDARVAFEGSIAGEWNSGEGTLEIAATVEGNGTSVRFELSATGDAVEGGVYHGSTLVATISGTSDQPVFTNAITGEPLTAEQLEALAEIFHSVEGLFDLAAGIFPAA
ncbi:MAG: hypothetical protein KY466_10730 [Gemmatimonadetes bacterium]|nr:hypothetical protein [Gemmatimonadota bacterium]